MTRRGADLASKAEGLQRAVTAARGRLDQALVDETQAVLDRAGQRLRLSAEHTVVALAGATGSGKSSLFNAIVGLDLAAVGVRRPTTSSALSCTWGTEGAGELLGWLGIPRRHQVSRDSKLDARAADTDLHGLVLLDLPDHDSTEVAHHLEVDRLVALADVLVWVLDPQKYADAAVHERYLKPLSSHVETMMVVVNRIDEIPASEVDGLLADVRRLLADDGLGSAPLLPTSARTGAGVDDLRRELVQRVNAKRSSTARLVADVEAAAARLSDLTGDARPGDVARSSQHELVDACADAAGVPVVVSAVHKAIATRARRATGWPVTAWLSRLRPDPLKRLHLGLDASGAQLAVLSRTSLPEPSRVQRARVDQAVRSVVDDVTGGLPAQWSTSVRGASVSRLDDVNDALDKAVTGTDLGVSHTPLWWRAVRLVQWVLFVAAVVGALWLLGLFGFAYLRLPEPPTPEWRGLAVPTLLLFGGAAAGVAVALLSRAFAGWSARRRASSADRRLRAGIAEVVDDLVLQPMESELDAYRTCRDGIAAARR
ncbi:MAG TPA: GTPase [Nocardioidaceae bacterium]|nr:GTPase [Nocardioidaceae bacterium]